MFTPLKLITSHGQTIWVEPTPASPHSCRPLSLLLGKETDETLKFYYKQLSSERKSIKESPLHVTVNEHKYKIKVKLEFSMIDGKMRAILSGLGGAFCMLCTCSREEAKDLTLSFSINRSSNEITEIWNKLSSGEILKKPHDHQVRQGVTQEPLVPWDDIAILSPLHSLLRFFDFLLKIVYHLNAVVFNWSNEEKTLGNQFRFLKKSKETVRAQLKEHTHLAIDIPDSTGKGGTSTTGNVIHAMLGSEANLAVLVNQVPERYRDSIHDLCSRAYAICKLYNSSQDIDVDKFKKFCADTKEIILSQFKRPGSSTQWIYLTPTVHGVLEHAHELIKANGNKGLGDMTESGLECNNKVLRLIRISLSRKTSQVENLSDCLERMWVKSDLEVRRAVPEKRHNSRDKYFDVKHTFEGALPYKSLCDYYLSELVSKK